MCLNFEKVSRTPPKTCLIKVKYPQNCWPHRSKFKWDKTSYYPFFAYQYFRNEHKTTWYEERDKIFLNTVIHLLRFVYFPVALQTSIFTEWRTDNWCTYSKKNGARWCKRLFFSVSLSRGFRFKHKTRHHATLYRKVQQRVVRNLRLIVHKEQIN